MIQVALLTIAFLGLYLQLAAFTGRMLKRASGCPDCRKGAKCPACLAASDLIRPGGGS